LAHYVLAFLEAFLDAGIKMKKLLRAESRLHSSLLLSDSFKLIVEETCKIIECDRASVYLIDK